MTITITPEAKEQLQNGVRVKFVMAGPSRTADPDQVITHVFPGDHTHSVTVESLIEKHPGFVPVGGGKIEGADTWWDSPSFRDEFGYDQPEGKMTGELLLQALEEGLANL